MYAAFAVEKCRCKHYVGAYNFSDVGIIVYFILRSIPMLEKMIPITVKVKSNSKPRVNTSADVIR